MAREAIYRNDDGRDVLPNDGASWAGWVAATATRNFVLGEPLLDWLAPLMERTLGYDFTSIRWAGPDSPRV